MATAFPAALDSFTNPTGGQVQGSTTPSHSGHHGNVNDAIEAIEAKLGIGADVAAVNELLKGTGAGATAFAQLVNADVAAAAAIVVSKLAAGGTANRVAATSDGTTMAMQQLATAMLASNAVTNAQTAFAASDVTLTGTTAQSDMNAAQMTVNYVSSGGMLIALMLSTIEGNAAGDWIQVGVSINGVTWTGTSFRVPTAGYYTGGMAFGMETPAAGTIVIKPRWQQGLSGSTSKSYGSGLKMLILELKTVTAVDLGVLYQQLVAAGVPVPYGLGAENDSLETVHTYDAEGAPAALPPDADPVLAAHVAPPLVVHFVRRQPVSSIVRTTDDQPLVVFRLATEAKHVYKASLEMMAVDAGTGATRNSEAKMTFKRLATTLQQVGTTAIPYNAGEPAAASWAIVPTVDGTDLVISVRGAAGRMIDWTLAGDLLVYAPEGLPDIPARAVGRS